MATIDTFILLSYFYDNKNSQTDNVRIT